MATHVDPPPPSHPPMPVVSSSSIRFLLTTIFTFVSLFPFLFHFKFDDSNTVEGRVLQARSGRAASEIHRCDPSSSYLILVLWKIVFFPNFGRVILLCSLPGGDAHFCAPLLKVLFF